MHITEKQLKEIIESAFYAGAHYQGTKISEMRAIEKHGESLVKAEAPEEVMEQLFKTIKNYCD